jgi:hypothetical protein
MIRIPVIHNYCGNYIRWYFNGYHYWQFSEATERIATAGETFATSGKKILSVSSLTIVLAQIEGLRSLMLTKDAQLYVSGQWVNIKILPGTQIIFDSQVNGYEMEVVFECSI